MFLLILEREKREEKGDNKQKNLHERNTYLLPPIHSLTRDQTQNLSMFHVPWLGIEPSTFGVWKDALNQLSHPDRAAPTIVFLTIPHQKHMYTHIHSTFSVRNHT